MILFLHVIGLLTISKIPIAIFISLPQSLRVAKYLSKYLTSQSKKGKECQIPTI